MTVRLNHEIELEEDLFDRIDMELNAYLECGLASGDPGSLIPTWQAKVDEEPKRFIEDNNSVNRDALRNFRRLQIFISDVPFCDLGKLSLRGFLDGAARGAKRRLGECLPILKEYGYDDLLREYPCHPAGNPHTFKREGFLYTQRWFRHVYHLGLMNSVLKARLAKNFVTLDIGSSYGVFSNLVKREFPESHHVLVDFPEQLILAHYFLGKCFPGARIAGPREVLSEDILSRDFIERFDFVLIPSTLYERLGPQSVDLVTNFTSFGEMTKTSFDYYTKVPPFTTARYFLTVNRMQSRPDHDTDMTILDYPIWDSRKRLHFATCPIYPHYYRRKWLFFFDKVAYPPVFEYVGEI